MVVSWAEIRQGDWIVELDGARGGQIVRADWRGHPVLAPGVAGRAAADQHAGCFPLLPYSNRIRNGQFSFRGRSVDLLPPEYSPPHALHGRGWRAPWVVAKAGPGAVRMTFEHAPGAWPWRYCAEQRVEVAEDQLIVTLSLTNLDTGAMPAGIGLHPYFVRPEGLRIDASTQGRWASAPDAPGLPTHRDIAPANLNAPGLDHCFYGWDGHARFGGVSGLAISLSASETLGNLVLYTPLGKAYFCAEPVSHVNDAANLEGADPAEQMTVLQPGQTLSGAMTIRCDFA